MCVAWRYGLRKFLHLSLAGNPSILDVLFAPLDAWRFDHPAWHRIHAARHAVLSQAVRHTYAGYAVAQLKRMQNHVRWLAEPPTEPDPTAFGGRYERGSWRWSDMGHKIAFDAALKTYRQYQTWLANRNPLRHALELAHGYDTKHGMHLVRLLLQAEQVLRTGTLEPRLSGSTLATVLDVRAGGWPYDTLIQWADTQLAAIHAMPSALPLVPDAALLEAVLMDVYRAHIVQEHP
jgi:hypothetical protein